MKIGKMTRFCRESGLGEAQLLYDHDISMFCDSAEKFAVQNACKHAYILHTYQLSFLSGFRWGGAGEGEGLVSTLSAPP